MKKVLCIIISLILTAELAACGQRNGKTGVGTGQEGVIEAIDWSGYDRLLDEAAAETDMEKRALIMHKAEDMLMDTGAVIPIAGGCLNYLLRPGVKGVYTNSKGAGDFSRIYKEGASPDEPIDLNAVTEIPTLDCGGTQTGDLYIISMAIGGGLVRISEDGTQVPDLAESYEVSDDGLVYSFRMRDGLKWSDGTPLTADDFVYSWNRTADEKNGLEPREMFSVISGYPGKLDISSSEEGKVFNVRLKSPCAYFTDLCTYVAYNVVKKDQVESAPGYRDADGNIVNPMGWANEAGFVSCGAYTVEDWQHGKSMTLRKNPNYYAADEITTETLHLMINADAASSYAAYESGDLDLLVGRIPSDILPVLAGREDFYVQETLTTSYLLYNVQSELYEGMTAEEACTFRKALGYAIDREFIRDIAMNGIIPVATRYVPGNIHDGTGGVFSELPDGYSYPYEDGYYPVKPDLDTARRMMESVGFTFGDDGKLEEMITMEYMVNPSPSNEAVATCLQADFAALGINLVISTMEWAVFLGERQNGRFETARSTWNADYDDAITMLEVFRSGASANDARLGK